MILCFQCEDLSKILLVSKFETNWPDIKLIITFCAIIGKNFTIKMKCCFPSLDCPDFSVIQIYLSL